MNIDITSWVSNVEVLVPLIKLAKVPLVNIKLEKLLGTEKFVEPNQVIDTNEGFPVILQAMTQ